MKFIELLENKLKEKKEILKQMKGGEVKKMTFKEIETDVWKPEKENDEITGSVLKKEDNVGANNSMLYTLEVENKPIGVWGSTILDPKMLGVNIGDLVKIVYLGKGEAKSGKNAPKIFKVLVDVPETPAE